MIRQIIVICLVQLLACVAHAAQCGYPSPAYINGINTSRETARDALDTLNDELRKTHPEITIELAYNQTEGFTLDLVESLYQKADTYHLRTADASLYIYGVISGSDTGLRDAPTGFLNDIKIYFTSHVSELVAQFTQIRPVYNQTLSDITGILRDSLANSPGLYLISHSQGSLFANDALYLLDQNELSAANGKRTTTGTYFIAPAASAQLASYGTGYTKFKEDLLSELGIGMVGNTSLFASSDEQTVYDSMGGGWMHHGMLDAYFNASGVQPFQRSYERITQKLNADLEALKAPCNYVESSAILNGQSITVVSDPVLGFDYDFCTSVTSMLSAPLPTRQGCLSTYAGTVTEPIDATGQALPINYVGKCNKTGSSVMCSKSYQVTTGNVQQSLLETFTASISLSKFTCKNDQFMGINHSTKLTTCFNWAELAVGLGR